MKPTRGDAGEFTEQNRIHFIFIEEYYGSPAKHIGSIPDISAQKDIPRFNSWY